MTDGRRKKNQKKFTGVREGKSTMDIGIVDEKMERIEIEMSQNVQSDRILYFFFYIVNV